MNAIRVRRQLSSHVVDIPELRPMVGKTVEIIVLEDQEPSAAGPGVGRRDASAIDAIAGRDLVDTGAVDELKRLSRV